MHEDNVTLERSVDSLCCELCGEPVAGEDGVPILVDGRTLMACPECSGHERAYRLDDGEDFTLGEFERDNSHDPECPDWIDALYALAVGESVTFGWNGPITRVR